MGFFDSLGDLNRAVAHRMAEGDPLLIPANSLHPHLLVDPNDIRNQARYRRGAPLLIGPFAIKSFTATGKESGGEFTGTLAAIFSGTGQYLRDDFGIYIGPAVLTAACQQLGVGQTFREAA